ncbi:7296_t:CDS:2, partial [Racocetra fulgida]
MSDEQFYPGYSGKFGDSKHKKANIEFLKKNRAIVCESPPFTNDWAGLNGRWFERFLQAVKSMNLPNSTSVIEEFEKKNVSDLFPDSGSWAIFPSPHYLRHGLVLLLNCITYYFWQDVRPYWEDVIDERKKAGAVENIGEEIEDDIKSPTKKLRMDTGKIPEPAENRERFIQLFGDLYIGKNPTLLATSFLILELNFSGLRTNETYEIFNTNFHTVLNIHMSWFMEQYQHELGRYFQVIDENADALANLLRLLKALYVFIDEYDASMNEALRNETIYQNFTNHQKKENATIKNKIELIESSFKQFFSCLKTACDKGIAYVFQTGVTPIVMAEFTSGFNISSDLALLDEFWDLHGFKKSEVEFLLDNIFGNSFSFDIKNGIMKWLKDEYAGYYFNPDQQEKFVTEALKIHDWKHDDLTSVRQCLQILEGNGDINPLCRFVEQVLLKPLKDNSIKHSNEEALKQAFLDALVLSHYADIEPEFQIYFQSNYSYGRAIDLVKTSTGKRIAIEFDNIKMECIKLDGVRDSWQEATRISLSLMTKLEDEILNLEINDPYRLNQKTIREALEWKIKKKCNEYLEPLKKRYDAELKCMFIVLRV